MNSQLKTNSESLLSKTELAANSINKAVGSDSKLKSLKCSQDCESKSLKVDSTYHAAHAKATAVVDLKARKAQSLQKRLIRKSNFHIVNKSLIAAERQLMILNGRSGITIPNQWNCN